ncbi:MAG: hypothetical protein H6571_15580 [Lewinellaceae bacterium]|nr:hypothetical protein [Lewinellaceae bacterium]MCB9325161.1 hypothetical protein [Lewinellaceae bacterium]
MSTLLPLTSFSRHNLLRRHLTLSNLRFQLDLPSGEPVAGLLENDLIGNSFDLIF